MALQSTSQLLPHIVHHRWRKPITFSAITLALLIFFIILNAVLTPQQVADSEWLSTLVIVTSLMNFLFITETIIKLALLHPRVRRHTNLLGLCIIVWIFCVRDFSIHFQFPALPYETSFFACFYPSIFGFSVPLGELMINASILLYFTLYAIRYINVQRFNDKGLNRAVAVISFSIVTCLAYVIFFVISAFIANIVLNTDYIITPNKVAFFDAKSYFLVSIIFCFCYCFALLIHKIVRILAHSVQHTLKRVVRFMTINYFLVAVVVLCCWRTIYGIPTWLLLALLALYLLAGVITYHLAKRNFRFTSILVKVIYFTLYITTVLYVTAPQRESEQRQQLISQIITNRSDTQSNRYAVQRVSWLPHSDQILNRHFINESSKITQKYSFGYYENGELADQYGKYDYKYSVKEYLANGGAEIKDVKARGYIHHIYRLSKDQILIIGEKDNTIPNFVASLSFFFISFLVYYLFCVTCINIFARPPRSKQSLYSNLLWISLTVLLIVGMVACAVSLLLYAKHTDSDQKDMVHVKTGGFQTTFLRHGVLWEDFYDETKKDSLQTVLEDAARMYILHINVYDLDGNLINCSDSNTLKEAVPLEPSVKAHFNQSYTYLYNKIKTERYIIHSLHKLVVDVNGKPCAYIKTCNVKNRYAWKMELSDIVTSFMCVHALLILLALLASWAIYAVVAGSMATIGKAMSKRKGANSPLRISWVESEEIGQLIREHNRLVEEIHQQADLLAKSERETAWRNMALEIAHEIKNPLTPMKLKMQMLQHAWHSGREDFPRKMDETSAQILKQIDALTEVADTFTEFASTQQSINKDENLREVMDEIRDALTSTPTTIYRLHYDGANYCHASIDRKLFIQMVHYLVKNADHNRNTDGRLTIDLTFGEDTENDKNWLLTFASNDRGLDEQDPELAFTVKFSAENCGHSLCLPIVKNIVSGFAGDINFTTSNKGTTFFIHIPKL